MMSRRRALLINIAANTLQKPYNIQIINSLQVHQADTTGKYSAWYTGRDFTVDADNGLFTVIDGSLFPLRYASAELFNYHMAGSYCILNGVTGSTMYFFSPDCTASYGYDESTGLYTITGNGRIQVFTPLITN